MRTICLILIKDNFLIYGNLKEKFNFNYINYFISNIIKKEVIIQHIFDRRYAEKIKSVGVKKIELNVLTSRNFYGNNSAVYKAVLNGIRGKDEKYSPKKKSLNVKFEIGVKDDKTKIGVNNEEYIKEKSLDVIQDDEFEEQYKIYLNDNTYIENSKITMTGIIYEKNKKILDFKDEVENF
jgi:hypothetical protein